MKKAIVLGMDGADWNIINRLIESGNLPNFNHLLNHGSYGTLESIPPLTAPAWSSITTGKKICNHGIVGFTWRDSNYNVRIVSSKDKKASDVWEYVDKSIILNVPITYPVKKINGIIVSGMLSPRLNEKSVYPGKEIKYLQEEGYVIEPKPNPKSILLSLNKRINIVKKYLKHDWNLFFVVFREFDNMQHNFWNDAPELYKIMDEFIGWLLTYIDNDTNIFIISDHGFNKIEKVFIIENWLWKNGYLTKTVEENDNNFLYQTFYRLGISSKRFLEKQGLSDLPIIKKILHTMKNSENKRVEKGNINFSKTKVFYGMWGELFLNTSKYNNGFIKNNEKYHREIIQQDLLNLQDEKGIKIIEDVLTKDELGLDDSLKSPDLMYYVNSSAGYSGTPSYVSKDILITANEVKKTGEHSKNAVFIAYGSNIKHGFKISNIHQLMDFTPTLIKSLEIHKNIDFDGKPIQEIFKK